MSTDDARSKWLLLGGTAVVAVGSLLPWATVNAGFVTVSKAGTDGDGVITLLFALVVGALALAKWKAGLTRGIVITSLVLGLLILAIAAYDTVDIASAVEETEFIEVRASVGIGLWLTLLGSIAMVVGAIWELRSPTRSDTATDPAAWGAGPNTAGYQPAPPYAAEQPMPPSSIPTSAPPPQPPPPPPPPPSS
jgi:hypothetical protein